MTRTLLLALTAIALPVFLSSTAKAQVVEVGPGPVIVHRHYHHHYWDRHRYWRERHWRERHRWYHHHHDWD
jgi:hypothetical protein